MLTLAWACLLSELMPTPAGGVQGMLCQRVGMAPNDNRLLEATVAVHLATGQSHWNLFGSDSLSSRSIQSRIQQVDGQKIDQRLGK
jgi:hypothetical protein